MTEPTDDTPAPDGKLVLDQTEDGLTRVRCRFANGSISLTQARIADLFRQSCRRSGTISEVAIRPR